MSEPTIIAKYTDPAYQALKSAIGNLSDAHPIALLPVRLETRYVNQSRIVATRIPGQSQLNAFVTRGCVLLRKLLIFQSQIKRATPHDSVATFKSVKADLEFMLQKIEAIPHLNGDDRRIANDMLVDIQQAVKKIKSAQFKKELTAINAVLRQLVVATKNIEHTKESVYAKGYQYLESLEKISELVDEIYYQDKASSLNIDDKLDRIHAEINAVNNLISEADFKATSTTISKIKSTISFIKRRQKNAFVHLNDFRHGYHGKRNLKTEEYALRNNLNALKLKIDQEHIPYMQLVDELKRYPVRRLVYRIEKATAMLQAANTIGYKTYKEVMATKTELYDMLHAIRERAHRPLDGQIADINQLKSKYALLEKQVQKFLAKTGKITHKDQYKRAALTRMHTHLTDEYLADLADLLPGRKTIEQQTISAATIRVTGASAAHTLANINAKKAWLKTTAKSGQLDLDQINAQLQVLADELAISTTHTTLIPRSNFGKIRGSVAGLKHLVNDFVQKKNVHKKNSKLAQVNKLLSLIENYVEDQQTDVFNNRDRFYDDYRKRITFIIKTEQVKELWVRIFPDDIAVDNHDERLSPNEVEVGKTFYQQVYSVPEHKRDVVKLAAWRAAAASVGVRRAAYIINKMLPAEAANQTDLSRKDGLQWLLDDLNAFLKKNKFRKPVLELKLATNPKFIEFIQNLKTSLSQAFLPANYHFCAENKISYTAFVEGLQQCAAILQKEQNMLMRSEEQKVYTALLEIIQESLVYLKQVLQNNLLAFSKPFVPNLTFGKYEEKTKSWDRAGLTNVLPSRFVVVTKRGESYEHIVVGNTIKSPVHLSIDPSADQAERFVHLPNGDLEVPEEIRWMFDFDAAVETGLGIRVPLQDADFTTKFDVVMAFGINETSAEEGQETINQLFKNHIYSDGGMEYLHVGTPTNNTEDEKTPYNALDNDFDGAYDLFLNPAIEPEYNTHSLTNEFKIKDGQFFKEAFGLPTEIARLIRHYNKQDISNGRAMNRALYNATLKYYTHIMVDNLLNNNDRLHIIKFLINHVSAVGTIPSFRIDNQPYGVLPITNYSQFKIGGYIQKKTEKSFLKNLTIFLNHTRKIFEGFEKKPQTVYGAAYENNPQSTFLKILGLEPYSKEFYYRFGTNVSSRWNGNQQFDLNINWEGASYKFAPKEIAEEYDFMLSQMGHTSAITRENAIKKSRAYINRYMVANFIKGDLVQDHNAGTQKLAKLTDFAGNYIDYLAANNDRAFLKAINVDEIPTVNIEGEEKIQNTLLFSMLRGSLLYDNSPHALRAYPILSKLAVPELERLLANHIDLCSYRLDAWLGGLADYRLKEMREQNQTGTFVGAYGFVTNLEPAPTSEKVLHLPEGLEPINGEDVVRMPDNMGFVHGPSMNHAVAAAVLRAGYKSLKSKGDNGNALAVNLTSARVRKALHLLEGVGNGQESGALLGYMFERALHDKYRDSHQKLLEMDTYIYRLRRKFPTFGDLPKDSDIDLSQQEDIKPANVVDGLAVIDHFEETLKNAGLWNDDQTFVDMMISETGNAISFPGFPWGLAEQLPDPNNPTTGSTPELEKLKVKAIIHEVDNMADAFDALSDLMNAEGVYQLVRGNHVRASAVLNALAEGRMPLDPEIINSMRQGVIVTQRVPLTIPLQDVATSPWLSVPLSAKAIAEPSLNWWLANKIGDPKEVNWQANFGNTETFISLEDLNLQPIDLVLLIATGGDDGMEELHKRCVNYLYHYAALAETDHVNIQFNISSPDAKYSFGEIVSLLQHLGKMVASARPLDARDFRIAEDEQNFGATSPGIDTVKMYARLANLVANYNALHTSLALFTPEKLAYTEAEREQAVDVLAILNQWSFTNYFPSVALQQDAMAMAAKIIAVKPVVEANLTFAASKLAELELEVDQGTWMSAIKELTEKLLGKAMPILPAFNCTNAAELQQQMAMPHNQGLLRNLPEDYLPEWLGSCAHVRERLSFADTAFALNEVLHSSPTNMQVAQLPFAAENPLEKRDFWLGAEYPESYKPNDDRLSLTCIEPENLLAQSCGLMLDEWLEIIPDKNETTGIAFHYDQPDARAPQTILMAVPPEQKGKWEADTVIKIVEEALKMASLRAVEPEHVDFSELSQLLPATATLAFGEDEFTRRFAGIFDEEFDETEQELGMYIDYTAVNHGIEPELEDEN